MSLITLYYFLNTIFFFESESIWMPNSENPVKQYKSQALFLTSASIVENKDGEKLV